MRVLSLAWVCTLAATEIESLGRQLFFDKRLSADSSISCATCHRPDNAFSDPNPVSKGVHSARGKFNAPTVLNLQKATRFFWDGRASSLTQQAEGPLLNPIEMANQKDDLELRIATIPDYQHRFKRSFGDPRITLDRITKAIAAYEKTLQSSGSLYDAWRRGRRERWTPQHELGRQLFFGTAQCSRCHSGPNFTTSDLATLNNGQRFKVPSLREVERTAPYMHDGSIPTLSQVLNQHQSAAQLSEDRKRALLRFLEALSGDYTR